MGQRLLALAAEAESAAGASEGEHGIAPHRRARVLWDRHGSTMPWPAAQGRHGHRPSRCPDFCLNTVLAPTMREIRISPGYRDAWLGVFK